MKTTGMRHYVIAYDIADDKRRDRVVKALKGTGFRVQYSLFEAELSEESLLELRMSINRVIDIGEDSVIYYSRCGHCRQDVIRDGHTPDPLEDEDMYFL
jgi:CRISPR-associated protein Cas2